jgi:effector-binding domain-containing protein
MISRAFARGRFAALIFVLIAAAPLTIVNGAAQQAAPATPATPATPGVSQPSPAAPATPPATPLASAPAATPSSPPAAGAPTPAPSASAPAAAPSATPATPPAAATPPASPAAPAPDGGGSDDSSSGQLLEMTAHPAAFIEGKANWSEGFGALTGALDQIKAELAKAGIAASGHPITVFTETDDNGFSYRAMVPIDKAPEGKTALSDAVKLGQTPAGKAMKFEHRGSYEDIDSTYEAITAYLDEKGLEAANLFVEEYLNEVKTPDDPNLQVDIYVLLK